MTISRIFALCLFLFAALPCAAQQPAKSTPAPADKAASQAGAPAPAPATPAVDEKLPSVPTPQFPAEQSQLDAWKAALDRTEAALAGDVTSDALNLYRGRVVAAQDGARDMIAAFTPRLETATARAAELAPDPKATAPQADSVKLERAKLLAETAALQGIIQQAKLIGVRSQQMLAAISEHRRSAFADSVLARSGSLINPSFWVAVAASMPAAADRLTDVAVDWRELVISQPLRAASGFAIAVLALLWFLLSPWRRWQARWTARDADVADPGPLRRTTAAAAIVLAGVAIPGVTLLVLYQALSALGLLPHPLSSLVRALFFGITFASFFISLANAVLAPRSPSWRLVGLSDTAASGMMPAATMIGIVIAIGILLDATNAAIESPPELILASRGLVAIIIAILFMIALRAAAPTAPSDDDSIATGEPKRTAWHLLIPMGWVVAAAAAIGPVAGYVAFGRFASGELVVGVTVLMSFVLLSQLSGAVIETALAYHTPVGRLLRQTVGLRSSTIRQMAVLLNGFTQLALAAFAGFIILTTWGISSDDLFDTMSSAFFSLSIGKFTISPSGILGALVVLVAGILATRTIQRWLDVRFLPETSLDVGVRSSIRTGVGYLGIILAAFVALSYVGLDLQNIVIVAGALSVGIGFGLQSIINNFVSGLILLVERPIKVGDRIEVGTRMGVVKQINVRATEILTYDNVSVIVPNADMISGQVVNWMHGNFTARLSVNVGTSYDADPDRVIAILLEIVAEHPRALKIPAPFAILSNFGADALEFTLFFHVGNIGVDAGAANDVRLEVLKRFRREGIEIPFAQRDIRLRDLDRIETLVRQIAGAGRSGRPDRPQ